MQVKNRVPLINCHGSDEDLCRQKRNYNIMIMLHPYEKIRNEKDKFLADRALVNVITDIGNFIFKEDVPACMPNTRGWENRKDYSKIVYYPK